jgi:hypothetical protein
MYGLVSIGKRFPYTIIKIIFPIIKDFTHYFINILFLVVDKETTFFEEQIHFSPTKKYKSGMIEPS